MLLGFFKIMLMVAGILLVFTPFVWPSGIAKLGIVSPHVGIIIGFVLVFLGQVASIILSIARQVSITFIFDITRQELQIDMKASGQYEFLPKSISLSDIRTLRLRRVEKRASVSHLLFEVVTDKDVFIPLTLFRSESKARRIAKGIQQFLQIPLIEDSISGYTFRSYKADFLGQFQEQSALDPSVDHL
jgi:hypothetical protein